MADDFDDFLKESESASEERSDKRKEFIRKATAYNSIDLLERNLAIHKRNVRMQRMILEDQELIVDLIEKKLTGLKEKIKVKL